MLLSSKGFYFASFLFRGNRCSKMSSANPGDVWGMGQRMRFCAPNWPLSHMWVEPHEVVLYSPLVSSAPTASMPTTPETGLALAASSRKEAWGNVWEMPEFHLMRLRVTHQLSVGMQFSLLTFCGVLILLLLPDRILDLKQNLSALEQKKKIYWKDIG